MRRRPEWVDVTRARWGRVTVAAVVVIAATAGCRSHAAAPMASPTTVAPVAGHASCARNPGEERMDGPLDWVSYGTLTVTRPWEAARGPLDHGMIQLATPEPIVLDSVTVVGQDPRYFSPVKVLRAWVSVGSDEMQEVDPGKWPHLLKPLACERIEPALESFDERLLVVRLVPQVGRAAHGRKWSADRGIVVHYHALDGTPYAAPFGYVNVFPTGPHVDETEGEQYLVKPRVAPEDQRSSSTSTSWCSVCGNMSSSRAETGRSDGIRARSRASDSTLQEE